MGVKRIIKCDDVKVVDVPQFEGLAIKDIFDFACNSADVENALPPPKEISKLSRSYLSNVIYTLMGEPFQAWITQQVNKRNQKVALEGNNVISMDPEIARIFQQSTAISGKCLSADRLILTIFVLCSLPRKVQPLDEGLGSEEKVTRPDPGGEASGPAEGGGYRREDGSIPRDGNAGRCCPVESEPNGVHEVSDRLDVRSGLHL